MAQLHLNHHSLLCLFSLFHPHLSKTLALPKSAAPSNTRSSTKFTFQSTSTTPPSLICKSKIVRCAESHIFKSVAMCSQCW
ncbi:hypothetical protein ACLB2K_011678 [Fragaria x ananassa]